VTAFERPVRRPPNLAVVWAMAAIVFWATMAVLGVIMFNATPRIAAFDLNLLVEAGRAVAAGHPVYDPGLVHGVVPDAVDLFYSYPPIVAQALAPVAGLPLGLIAILWSVASIGLLAVAAVRIVRLVQPAVGGATVATGTIAVAAVTFPLLIAVLFGNLDAFFPALYGFALLGALSPRTRDGVAGGAALAIAAVTKVYPAGLGLWFVVRAATRWRVPAERRRLAVVVGAAVVVGLGLVGLSVLVFGLGPWQDYSKVAATAARAEIVDGRNGAPAAQLALWIHAGSDTARLLHIPVAIAAALAIVVAAWRVADPLLSLTIAATASLLLLPISWIHYPAALLPFGAAAIARAETAPSDARRRVRALAAGALLAGALAVTWLPSLWIGMGLALAAVRASDPARRPADAGAGADDLDRESTGDGLNLGSAGGALGGGSRG
jgi:alpha-1,2-mannosyltransferase